jgi:hypothetical protein
MVNYSCSKCNYFTKNKTDYNKHCKTKKHNSKNKISTILHKKTQKSTDFKPTHICGFCNKIYTRTDSLKRHQIKCKKKNNIISSQILEEKLKHELETKEIYKEELEHYKRELDYYKNMLNVTSGMVQQSFSTLTYIVNNYDKAPVLKKINIDDIKLIKNNNESNNSNDNNSNDNNKLISEIFHAYKHGEIGMFIGDLIVKIYKKKNPSNQSIWNTDSSRLTYLIKKIIYDDSNKSKWMVDKKGVETMEYLITPIIDKIKLMAIKYHSDTCLNIEGGDVDYSKILMISELFGRFIIDIDNKKIHKSILKYISSHFYMSTKDKKSID